MYDGDAPRASIPEEDAEYLNAAAARDAKRAAKEEKYRRSAGIAVPMEEEMDVDEKRDVGGKIMANRGLTHGQRPYWLAQVVLPVVRAAHREDP